MFIFLLLSFKIPLYILDTSPFSKYFLPVCGLSFHSLNSNFNIVDILNEIHIISFILYRSWFGCCIYKYLLPDPRLSRFSHFISKFHGLVFNIYMCDTFWFSFCKFYRSVSKFFFLVHVDDQHHFLLKRLSFLHWIVFTLCQRSVDYILEKTSMITL